MTIKTTVFLAVTSLTVLAQEKIHLPRIKNEPPYYKLINSKNYIIRTNRPLGAYCIRYKPLIMYDNYYPEINMQTLKKRLAVLNKCSSMSC